MSRLGLLLEPNGQKPGPLLSVPLCRGGPSPERDRTQDVSGAEAEEPRHGLACYRRYGSRLGSQPPVLPRVPHCLCSTLSFLSAKGFAGLMPADSLPAHHSASLHHCERTNKGNQVRPLLC